MATTLFLRDVASDLGGAGRKALLNTRGTASILKVTATTAGGTDIQVTDTSGGQVLVWLSPPLNAVTISGNVTVNIRGVENAAATNSGAGILVQRADNAGNPISDIIANTTIPVAITEYSSVADSAKTAIIAPTSTALSAGDRVMVTLKVRNVGVMAVGTVSNSIDGTPAGTPGDTYVMFTENLTEFHTASVAFSAAATFTAAGIKSVAESAAFSAVASFVANGTKTLTAAVPFSVALSFLPVGAAGPSGPTKDTINFTLGQPSHGWALAAPAASGWRLGQPQD